MPSRPSRSRHGCASAFTCLCLASASCTWAGDLAQSPNLFFIKRNKNANEVHYDARVHDCKWQRPELDSYWRELNKGQDVYVPVRFYEEPAYGFDVNRVSDTEIRISFKALPGRLVTARLVPTSDKGCTVAVGVDVNGKPAELSAIYVYATEGLFGLMPTVRFIDIMAFEGGRPVFERVRTEAGTNTQAPDPDPSRWRSGASRLGRH